jgi:hypothetical protein
MPEFIQKMANGFSIVDRSATSSFEGEHQLKRELRFFEITSLNSGKLLQRLSPFIKS